MNMKSKIRKALQLKHKRIFLEQYVKDRIIFRPISGNINDGKFKIYGI